METWLQSEEPLLLGFPCIYHGEIWIEMNAILAYADNADIDRTMRLFQVNDTGSILRQFQVSGAH
jgi:hypothetical protein